MSVPKERTTVLVTGFGPFRGHEVNASWEAVKELSRIGLGDSIDLIIYEIPVEYETVKKIVPEFWEKHKPHLVVHVGVSSFASELTIEQQAHNDGYDRLDVKGCTADSCCCVEGADNVLVAGLNMKTVCDDVNCSGSKAKAEISHDPGRYLCDYSYFTSLHINRDRCAFIHVPPLDSPYSGRELAEGLKAAILAMLKQLGL